MYKKLILPAILSLAFCAAKAQDTVKVTSNAPLIITGSVDAYYKYDLAGKKVANIPTSFGNEPNSMSIGMLDLGLKKKVGKAQFVGELSFGPRSDQSIPTSGYHIQNLYVSYDVTEKFNLTAGY